MNKVEAQKKVWDFVHEFRDHVVKELKDHIDFIIMYGSAVRGEFVPGKSDVDILFQVFKASDKAIVEKRATELFWQTAEKYPELGFEKSLSVADKKKRDHITKILNKLEKSSFLYVPVFVFVKGEIDWKHGTLKTDNPLIKLGQNLLIPQRSVFLRFQQEGRLLYGRDIKKEMDIHLTLLDRLRLGLAPQLLSLIGFLLSPISPKKARGYAVKALLYQVDSLITAVSRYKRMERDKKIKKAKRLLLNDFTDRLQKMVFMKLDHTKGLLRPSDFNLFSDAVRLKWGEKRLTYLGTIWFCFKAFFFILRSNLRALGYLFLKKKQKDA